MNNRKRSHFCYIPGVKLYNNKDCITSSHLNGKMIQPNYIRITHL